MVNTPVAVVDVSSLALTPLDIGLRMLLAMLIGAVIGTEREYTHRPAGMRTHMLAPLWRDPGSRPFERPGHYWAGLFGRGDDYAGRAKYQGPDDRRQYLGHRLSRRCRRRRILYGGGSGRNLYFGHPHCV